MRRLFVIAAVLAGLTVSAVVGATVAVWAIPQAAEAYVYKVPHRAVSPYGWDANDDGGEILVPDGGGTEVCATGGTQLTDAGGAAQNPTADLYRVVTVTDDVYLCDAATCADPNGNLFLAGSVEAWKPDAAGAYSCRSTSGSGYIRLEPVQKNR